MAPNDNRNTQWKFALINSMIQPIIHWSTPCLDTLDLVACMLHCRHNITTFIYACTLNVLYVTNVNVPNPLALAMVSSQIRILLVILGRILQLILLAHGLHQHHMVLWNFLLSLVLTP